MTSYQIPYGTNQLTFEIPDNEHVELIEPPLITTPLDPIEEIHEALRNSIGRGLPKKGSKSKIAVVVNDKTRPVPNKILIPLLVDELRKLGYSIKDIQFFIASGIHLPLTQDEINCLLPEEILQNCVCVSHDCDDFLNLVDLGFSKRRTPITINKKFYESDVKILVGNIEPHHFAGFSGGYKTAVIGLGGRKTINHNHSLLMDPLSSFGEFLRNPLRNDIDEIGAKLGNQFALNVVMNVKREIVKVFFGDPLRVMKMGILESSRVCMTQVDKRFSIVIASVGGHPKDINLYQSQKALSHASAICEDNGVVILVARCPEGSGNKEFEDFMFSAHTPEEALNKFKLQEFIVGPHKAYQFARELLRIKVILVSELDNEMVKRLMLVPAVNIQDALSKARNLVSTDASFALLPHATNTIPKLA